MTELNMALIEPNRFINYVYTDVEGKLVDHTLTAGDLLATVTKLAEENKGQLGTIPERASTSAAAAASDVTRLLQRLVSDKLRGYQLIEKVVNGIQFKDGEETKDQGRAA